MGYSYTVKAGHSYDYMLSILRANEPSDGPCNQWTYKGQKYFEESSRREHADGRITSTVYRTDANNLCQKVGGILISADGTVVRWPTSSAGLRKAAKDFSDAKTQLHLPMKRFVG
jgi:hypothetical protein